MSPSASLNTRAVKALIKRLRLMTAGEIGHWVECGNHTEVEAYVIQLYRDNHQMYPYVKVAECGDIAWLLDHSQ